MDFPDASPESAILSLQHGEFKELGTSDESIRESLVASITKGDDCDKRAFYKGAEWPGSGNSTQTEGEIEILKQLAPQIAHDLKNWSSLVLVEYGSGYSHLIQD